MTPRVVRFCSRMLDYYRRAVIGNIGKIAFTHAQTIQHDNRLNVNHKIGIEN